MWEIRINKEEIKDMMQDLDEGKAILVDGVAGYILKKCRQEMAESFHDIIQCTMQTGKVPKKWKRADIKPPT